MPRAILAMRTTSLADVVMRGTMPPLRSGDAAARYAAAAEAGGASGRIRLAESENRFVRAERKALRLRFLVRLLLAVFLLHRLPQSCNAHRPTATTSRAASAGGRGQRGL